MCIRDSIGPHAASGSRAEKEHWRVCAWLKEAQYGRADWGSASGCESRASLQIIFYCLVPKTLSFWAWARIFFLGDRCFSVFLKKRNFNYFWARNKRWAMAILWPAQFILFFWIYMLYKYDLLCEKFERNKIMNFTLP